MSEPHELSAGDRLGRYVIIRKLGSGGMGAVYLARDERLSRQVALKIPHFEKNDEQTRQRFLREAKLAAGLPHHAHLCPVHDADQINGKLFFVMPFIEGQSLRELIVPGQPWPVEKALEVVGKIAQALVHLHERGIVHRDLKPANVMMQPSGEPLLMDLGLARSFQEETSGLTETGKSMGTPAYMAPEQFSDARRVKEPADIYSLGVLLYELLTTQRPFHARIEVLYYQILNTPPEPPSKLRPGLDPRLDSICLKALSKTPEQRQQHVGEFLSELRATAPRVRIVNAPTEPPRRLKSVGEQGHSATEVGEMVAVEPSAARGSNKWVFAVLCLLVLGIPTGWLLFGGRGGDPGRPPPLPSPGAPARAKAPFDAKTAKALQLAWAAHLGRMVEEVFDLGDGVKLTVVLIPPGTFTMGSPKEEQAFIRKTFGESAGKWAEQEVPHEVTITKPFYLGKFEVTQEQFAKLLKKAEPNYFSAVGVGRDAVKGMDTAQFPVESVSWEEALQYCEALGKKVKSKAELPSEAEWEFACRAGTATPFHFGDILTGAEANCDGRYPYGTKEMGIFLNRTCAVGSYGEYDNAFGLFDMHGNVYEWCADYNGPYAGLASKDPLRTEKEGESARIVRGGSFASSADWCRAARRNWGPPTNRTHRVGFRVAFRLD